jgi:hypothetical protein
VDPAEPLQTAANEPGAASGPSRLTLEALGVIWPKHLLAGSIARGRALVSAWGSTQSSEECPSPADLVAREQYWRAYGTALGEARAAIASANDWWLAAPPEADTEHSDDVLERHRHSRPGYCAISREAG